MNHSATITDAELCDSLLFFRRRLTAQLARQILAVVLSNDAGDHIRLNFTEPDHVAKAAEDLASGKLPASTAVIAAKAAAQVYKLDILEESIQDLKFNYTSFIAAEKMK